MVLMIVFSDLWGSFKNVNSIVAIGGRDKLSNSIDKETELFSRVGGYLIPLINRLITGLDYSPGSSEPLVIIICPDWPIAQVMAELCSLLGRDISVDNDGKKFNVGCVFANEKAHAVDLTNGCHVLVTTPDSLIRMMDLRLRITSLERCCHLIFERADECFEKFNHQIKIIMDKFNKFRALATREPNQIIVSSDEWTTPVKEFIEAYLMKQDIVGPQIFLGHPLEALVYSQMKLKVHSVQGEKWRHLMRFLKNTPSEDKLKVVFVSDDDSLRIVQANLDQSKVENIAVKGDMSPVDVGIIVKDNLFKRKVFIICDKAPLEPMNFSAEDMIIHYDYPASKLQFASRFLHLKKCVKSIYEEVKETIENCHLLVHSDDQEKIKTIYNLLKRTQSKIPKDFLLLKRHAEAAKALNLIHEPLCDNIKIRGQCQTKCKQRDFIAPVYDSKGCYGSGKLEFHVVKVHKANFYDIRIVRVVSNAGQILIDADKVNIKLLKLNMKAKLLEKLDDVRIGQVLVIRDPEDESYKRGKVVVIKKKEFTIFLIDEGKCLKGSDFDFFKIPNEFNEDVLPRLACQAVISSIKPKDQHSQWPIKAEEQVRRSLINGRSISIERFFICRSKFLFSLSNTFWVANVQGLELMEDKKTFTPIFDIKQQLEVFADEAPEHVERLLKLCQSSTLDKEKYKTLLNNEVKQVEVKIEAPKVVDIPAFFNYRSAFLDLDAFNADVVITNVQDPGNFVVQLLKFQKHLRHLECDLKQEHDDFLKSGIEFEPQIGQICIGKYAQDHYCRVKYLSLDLVYYLDYGNEEAFIETLAPIKRKSLEKMPFQAIKCSLNKVCPMMDEQEFSQEAIDAFSEYIDCHLWVNNAKKIAQDKYSVDLTIPETSEIINHQLKLKGYVIYDGNIIDVSKFEVFHDTPAIKEEQIELIEKEELKEEPANAVSECEELGKRLPLYDPQVPEDMPSLCFPEKSCPSLKLPQSVIWTQDLQQVQVQICLAFEVKPRQVFVQVEAKTLYVACLNVTYDESNVETVGLFEIPYLSTFSDVMKKNVTVKISGRTVKITLKKIMPIYWPHLFIDDETNTPLKLAWLKSEAIEESSDEEQDDNHEVQPKKYLDVQDVPSSSDLEDDNERETDPEDESSDEMF